MFNYFLGAALVAVPFFFKSAPISSPNLSQDYFLALATMLGVLCFGIRRTNIRIQIIGVSLCSIAFMAVNPFGIFQYYQLAMSFIGALFIALVYANKRRIDFEFIGKCFALVCLLESAWIILQFFQIDINAILLGATNARPGTTFGSLGNPNHSGALVAVTLPFLSVYFWPLPFIALALGKSTMPVICALISVVALLSYRKKNYLIIKTGFAALFVAALIVASGIIPANSYFTDSNRVYVWKKLISETGFQLTGKGFGFIPDSFSKIPIFGEKFYQAHNEWIELYTIAGLLGVGVGLYLILPVFKNKGNPAINACLISLLVNSLGNFTMHIAPLFMIFGTCYAFQLSQRKI